MEWISIGDKLPCKNTPVLLHYVTPFFRNSCQGVAMLFDETGAFRILCGGATVEEPTHWMPLPEAPTS